MATPRNAWCGWDLGDPDPSKPSALPRTLSRARKMTAATVIAGQVKHIRTRRACISKSAHWPLSHRWAEVLVCVYFQQPLVLFLTSSRFLEALILVLASTMLALMPAGASPPRYDMLLARLDRALLHVSSTRARSSCRTLHRVAWLRACTRRHGRRRQCQCRPGLVRARGRAASE